MATIDESAWQIIRSTLAQYGLDTLAAWAWDSYKGGAPPEQIFLEMRQRDEYKARFPAMAELAAQGRAISEAEYISFERSWAQLVQQYGLPEQTYDTRARVTSLLTNDVSLAEAQERIEIAQAASLTADPGTRQQLQTLYGVSPGDLTAYWLEPDTALPVIQRQYASSRVAAEYVSTGLGQVQRSAAERMVAAGVSLEQARSGARSVSRELTVALPGEVESALGVDVVATGSVGLGAEAEEVARLRRRRAARFATSGEALASSEGITGLGTTQR